MSLFSGGRAKDKDSHASKSQFYVEFMGWMECRAVRGNKYTDPIIRELRRRHKKLEAPPKLTIEVSAKEIKITQEIHERPKKGIKKITFPSIPARDVTYVRQGTRSRDGRPDDIVACIYLGYMPRTQRYVHVHVYRFDEPQTAAMFVHQMTPLVERNQQRIRDVEQELASKGEIDDPGLGLSNCVSDPRSPDLAVGSNSSNGSEDEPPTFSRDDIDPDLQSLKDVHHFDSVTEELKYRLQLSDAPLLLPPKDYDTIRRGYGNLVEINRRRCMNLNVVGSNVFEREANNSSESGIESISPARATSPAEVKKIAEKINNGKTSSKDDASKIREHSSDTHKNFISDANIQHFPNQTSNLGHYSNLPTPSSNRANPRNAETSKSSNRPRNNSPDDFALDKDFVYPPKVNSPPPFKSNGDKLQRQQKKNALIKQISDNTRMTSSLEQEAARGLAKSYQRSSSSNDVYAVPVKKSSQPPRNLAVEELPPDYQEDGEGEEVILRGMKQRYSQAYLTRRVSANQARGDYQVGSDLRPLSESSEGHSRDLRHSTGEMPRGMQGLFSPPLERVGSSYRK